MVNANGCVIAHAFLFPLKQLKEKKKKSKRITEQMRRKRKRKKKHKINRLSSMFFQSFSFFDLRVKSFIYLFFFFHEFVLVFELQTRILDSIRLCM